MQHQQTGPSSPRHRRAPVVGFAHNFAVFGRLFKACRTHIYDESARARARAHLLRIRYSVSGLGVAMSSDTVSDLRMTADGVATEIPPTTTAPSNTETELSQPEPGSPSKRSSKVGSPYKQLSRRFTSKKVIRVRKEKFSNDSVRGDGFMLFILNRVPHVAVLIIVTAMVAMAFVHAPAGNPRQDEAWTLRPIQWGETQNMWMPFYSFFAMLMTLLFFHSFVRIAIVAEVHCAYTLPQAHIPTPPAPCTFTVLAAISQMQTSSGPAPQQPRRATVFATLTGTPRRPQQHRQPPPRARALPSQASCDRRPSGWTRRSPKTGCSRS